MMIVPEKFTVMLIGLMILGMLPDKRPRYFYLILFVIAVCAAFYLLLYLFS